MGKEQLTIEVDADLVRRLRDAGVDPSSYVHSLLSRKAAEQRTPQESAALSSAWLEDNEAALREYNEQVERIGTFASRQRARRKNATP